MNPRIPITHPRSVVVRVSVSRPNLHRPVIRTRHDIPGPGPTYPRTTTGPPIPTATTTRGCADAVPAPARARKPPTIAVASATFFITPLLIFSSSFMFACKTSRSSCFATLMKDAHPLKVARVFQRATGLYISRQSCFVLAQIKKRPVPHRGAALHLPRSSEERTRSYRRSWSCSSQSRSACQRLPSTSHQR